MEQRIEIMNAVENTTMRPQNTSIAIKILKILKAQIGVIIGTSLFLLICILMYAFSSEWKTLSIKAWMSILITIFTVSIVLTGYWPASFVMFGGLSFVYGLGIIDATSALAGFSNTGVMTVALMFIVAKTVELSGILRYVNKYLLGKPKSLWIAQLRLFLAAGIMSMFINNTPVTIMMIPVVQVWSQQIQFPLSKFLLPMAYSIIIGGSCSIIGTSSNMVTLGLAQSADPSLNINIFETAIIGVPIFILALFYEIIFSRCLISSNKGAKFTTNNKNSSNTNHSIASDQSSVQKRRYTSSFRIPSKSRFIGKKIQDTALLGFKGIELIAITSKEEVVSDFGDSTIQPRMEYSLNYSDEEHDSLHNYHHHHQLRQVGADNYDDYDYEEDENDQHHSYLSFDHHHRNYLQLRNFNEESDQSSIINQHAGDQNNDMKTYDYIIDRKTVDPLRIIKSEDILYFRGSLRDMYLIYQIEGLEAIDINQVKKISGKGRSIVEVVLSSNCKAIGKTVIESRFRTTYNAVILGVYRSSEPISQRIGSIVLKAGDVLLLETTPDFLKVYKNSADFLLVSEGLSGESTHHRIVYLRMTIVVSLLLIMIVASAIQLYSTLQGTFFLIVIYIIIEAITWEQAISSLQANTLLVIACAFALGNALEATNATVVIADSLIYVFEIFGRIGVLSGLFICTALLCTIISNTAVVTIMFPIARQFAYSQGISIKCVTMTLMLASSCLFPSPLGYQVLMAVHAVGGYKFSDYLKFGFPLAVLYFFVSVPLIYYLWADDFNPSQEYQYENQNYFPAVQ